MIADHTDWDFKHFKPILARLERDWIGRVLFVKFFFIHFCSRLWRSVSPPKDIRAEIRTVFFTFCPPPKFGPESWKYKLVSACLGKKQNKTNTKQMFSLSAKWPFMKLILGFLRKVKQTVMYIRTCSRTNNPKELCKLLKCKFSRQTRCIIMEVLFLY